MQSKTCPSCGARNPISARFCGGCGQSLLARGALAHRGVQLAVVGIVSMVLLVAVGLVFWGQTTSQRDTGSVPSPGEDTAAGPSAREDTAEERHAREDTVEEPSPGEDRAGSTTPPPEQQDGSQKVIPARDSEDTVGQPWDEPTGDPRPAANSLKDMAQVREESDPEVREAVRNALDAANLQVSDSGYGLPHLKEGNSGAVWRPLYDSLKGREIPELRRVISFPRERDDTIDHLKAITFLTYSLRMDEGKAHAEPVFAQLLLYDIYEPWTYIIKRVVDEALMEIQVPLEKKNEMILEYVRSFDSRRAGDCLGMLPAVTPDSARENTHEALIQLLANRPDLDISHFREGFEKLTPPNKREETGAALLRRLEQSPDSISYALNLFKAWKLTSTIPRLRALIPVAEDSSVLNLTRFLAEFDDKESEPEIRGVVERYRYGNEGYSLDSVLSDLIVVAGSDVDEYLAEVLQTASPESQEILLRGSVKKVKSELVRQAVEELYRDSMDTKVKKAAASYLGLETK